MYNLGKLLNEIEHDEILDVCSRSIALVNRKHSRVVK